MQQVRTRINWPLEGEPYDVQLEAIKKANGHRGFGFFMEMGLGKTATAYAEFLILFSMNKVNSMIIICPQSLKKNWEVEAKKWGVDTPVTIWPNKISTKDNFILTMNYEALIGKGGEYLDSIMDYKIIYMVLDESIHVKNPRAKRTKRLINICKMAEYVRLMSGAPIVQSPLDLWGQMRCIGELVGYNPFAFRNHFCIMGGYMNRQITGTRNEEELVKLIDLNAFRAKKIDWADLPETLFTARDYEMEKGQFKCYEKMRKELVLQVKDEVIAAPMVITQMMKLQQISSGFIIDEQGDINDLVDFEKNPKLKLAKEIVEELDTKVIIFAFYKRSIANLLKLFPKGAFLIGEQNIESQEKEKRYFNDGSAKVVIAQLTAGKYGHNLLGTQDYPCHTTIFYENTYNLDARIQAEARNHRYGQHYPVTYIDLIGTNLDRKVVCALQKKTKNG